jgi:hypothetical protein
MRVSRDRDHSFRANVITVFAMVITDFAKVIGVFADC